MESGSGDAVSPLLPATQEPASRETESSLPFTSYQPKVGDPPLEWGDFEKPKRRRFPAPRDNITLRGFLDRGEDGYVIKARIKGQEDPVAVKIFRHNRQPPPINIRIQPPRPNPRYAHQLRPPNYYKPADLGVHIYWSFERECINCTLLEKIETGLQHAATVGKPIFLNPNPKTRADAHGNLQAFSTQGRTSESKPPPETFAPFVPNVQITRCFGWTEFKGSDINTHLKWIRAQCFSDLKDDETFYAIVFAHVPAGKLQMDNILAQLDFFHVTGFMNVAFNENNWLGDGALVDFSDLVHPFSGRWWRDSAYPLNVEVTRRLVDQFAKRALLSNISHHPRDLPPSEPHPSGMCTPPEG